MSVRGLVRWNRHTGVKALHFTVKGHRFLACFSTASSQGSSSDRGSSARDLVRVMGDAMIGGWVLIA